MPLFVTERPANLLIRSNEKSHARSAKGTFPRELTFPKSLPVFALGLPNILGKQLGVGRDLLGPLFGKPNVIEIENAHIQGSFRTAIHDDLALPSGKRFIYGALCTKTLRI